MKKKFLLLFIVTLLVPLMMSAYNYSYYGDVLHSSPGYNYITHFNQQNLGYEYSDPQDLKVYNDKIYILAKDKNKTKDLMLVLDSDFTLLKVYDKYSLTSEYQDTLLEQVDSTFDQIKVMYQEILENKVFYPETVLPLNEIKKIIPIISVTWTSEDDMVVHPSGYVDNYDSGVVSNMLTLELTLLGKTETFEFEVLVGPHVWGIEVEDFESYSVEEVVTIQDLNKAISSLFDEEEYETVLDLIFDNRIEDELEFIYEGYKFEFIDSPYEDATFEDIVITLIEDEKEETESELHGSMFQEKYTTNKAQGFEIVDSGIYIADTENGRIVKLNHDFEVVDSFYGVEDETFVNHIYKPLKITVDSSERMYIIANNVFEGIIELDSKGNFNRYTGVNPIKLSPYDIFKRMLMTEEQKAKLQKYLPTDYTNLVMDEKSFIFATAKPRENNSDDIIQLINPKGVDVLKRNGYHIPKGDVIYVTTKNNYVIEGPSDLVDIAIGNNGIYSVLDNKRSRIFTYDREGNLLYINGDKGEQSDKFNRGIALEYFGDNILVLDDSGTLIVYRPTDFGIAVNKAVEYYSLGDFASASKEWEKALVLNTNYEIAYNGIGMYHLREKNFKEAMKNFKLGHNQYYYSKAFKEQRNFFIKNNFAYLVLGIVLISGSYIAFKVVKKSKRGDE